MQYHRLDASNTKNQLPPLAPKGSRSGIVSGPSTAESNSGLGSGSRPRLSHRSRAGCWTCRKRKVKCDEIHPKCGPCTRLNKDCDWEFRWKFDDVTTNTQNKYQNVSTTGNVVWDPQASRQDYQLVRSQSTVYDGLPSFAALTNDGDRERKAEAKKPGTYNVIVNPQSFANLPEYGKSGGARSPRLSINSYQSEPSSVTSPSASSNTSREATLNGDPNIVVLSKFEDNPVSTLALPAFSSSRRTSLPDSLQRLEITVSSRGSSLPSSKFDLVGFHERDERLMVHYRGFIAKRILPIAKNFYLDQSTDDPIVAEARSFPPLYHAICAICLLSLALKGQQKLLPEAFQHYHQAVSSSAMSSADLHSDRLIYLHFLLLVYDICYATHGPKNPQDGLNMSMWMQHIHHLLRIVTHRQGQSKGHLPAYLPWYVLFLDIQASLGGNGSGSFVRAYVNREIQLPDWQQPSLGTVYNSDDSATTASVYSFTNAVFDQGARLPILAQRLRSEALTQDVNGLDPQVLAGRQHLITEMRERFYGIWTEWYPPFLARDPTQAAALLSLRPGLALQFASIQFSASIVYLLTSMFPGQRLYNLPEERAEIAHHCSRILTIASLVVEAQDFDQHHIVFPLFLAGFATTDGNAKLHAIHLMQAMEGTGISRNSTRSRDLLVGVCDEQRRRVLVGGRAEEVDWIAFARSSGLGVVNFGL